MPLPDALQTFVTSRRFWTDYLWETEGDGSGEDPPFPSLEDCRLRLLVGEEFELQISLDDYLSDFGLDFIAPGQPTVRVAWDDQAHWHPHVLRWVELETICQAVAARDRDFSHPGYPVLFLHRFAPICEGDDLAPVVATLETAWRRLGLFSTGEITTFIERIDARDAGFRWQWQEGLGWCIEQTADDAWKGLYSLRQPANKEFPFADWQRMIEVAERQAAQLGSNGESIAVPVCFPREKHALELTIPYRDPDRPVPVPFTKLLGDSLDRIVRDLNKGRSDASSSSSIRNDDGTFTETESSYNVEIKGPLNDGVATLRDLLWWSGAPQSVHVCESYRDEIPMNLSDPGKSDPLVLQLGQLTTVRWQSSDYRFDRVPFSEATRQRLQKVLLQSDSVGPDEDGWFEVTTPDGGHLRLCARNLKDDPASDGLTLAITHVTPEMSEWIYQRMTEEELLLLPPIIAPNAQVAKQVDAAWPNVRIVETPDGLHEILTAGAYSWWTRESRP